MALISRRLVFPKRNDSRTFVSSFSRGILMNHPRRDRHMDVTILLGSSSDMPVAEKCTKILEHFNVSYQLRVASAHRSPQFVEQIIHDAENDGCQLFIAMAGLAAALPGAVAALTTKPVIGVPCGGRVPFDSLLSIVQLPPGVPAATVGVDRGDNAGYLATQILALKNPEYAAALKQNKLDQVERVKAQDREVNGGV
jgi:5-(carboxyamino)imidazole ribonucleotide mutase